MVPGLRVHSPCCDVLCRAGALARGVGHGSPCRLYPLQCSTRASMTPHYKTCHCTVPSSHVHFTNPWGMSRTVHDIISWGTRAANCHPLPFAQAGGSLLEVCVGDRATWKSKTHPFRLDPNLQLTGIPTLSHWTPNGIGIQDVGLETASTEAEAAASVTAFIAKTRGPR